MFLNHKISEISAQKKELHKQLLFRRDRFPVPGKYNRKHVSWTFCCHGLLAAAATKDTIVAVSTAGKQEKDDYDIASTSVISAQDTIVAVSAAGKQEKDDYDIASTSVIAFASTSATTICCS